MLFRGNPITTLDIWELMRKNIDLDNLFEDVPEEFLKWSNKIRTDLQDEFDEIEYKAQTDFEFIERVQIDRESRREFEALAKKTKYPKLLRLIWDGEDYQTAIWEMIKPTD